MCIMILPVTKEARVIVEKRRNKKNRERKRKKAVCHAVRQKECGGWRRNNNSDDNTWLNSEYLNRIVFHLMVNAITFSSISLSISFTPLSLQSPFRLSTRSYVCNTFEVGGHVATNNSTRVTIMPNCHVISNKITKYVSTPPAISYSL